MSENTRKVAEVEADAGSTAADKENYVAADNEG